MPRTPHEATRFTSTQINAQSKPPSSTIQLPTSAAPPNETPQQKVNRLREAARRAKLDQETTWDKVVLRGRVWADRAHRVTATGLIGASIVATGFAAISFGDMIMANRQKKKDWYDQQNAAYDRALAIAKQAEANGTLTSDLALFLNKERAVEQAEAEKKAAGTFWQRTKRRLFSGLKMEGKSAEDDILAQRTVLHASGNQAGIEAAESSPAEQTPQRTTIPKPSDVEAQYPNPEKDPAQALHIQGGRESAKVGADVPSLVEASPVPRTNAEDSRVVESRAVRSGGPLDRVGEQTSASLSQLASGLLGRFRGS